MRLSQENGVYIIRGMFVHEAFQKQGIGRKMLSVFEEHLKNRDISQAFLIRGPHLEAFYGQIGFHKTDSSAPQFLMDRSRSYEKCYGMNLSFFSGHKEERIWYTSVNSRGPLLAKKNGSIPKTTKELGISDKSLYKWIKEL